MILKKSWVFNYYNKSQKTNDPLFSVLLMWTEGRRRSKKRDKKGNFNNSISFTHLMIAPLNLRHFDNLIRTGKWWIFSFSWYSLVIIRLSVSASVGEEGKKRKLIFNFSAFLYVNELNFPTKPWDWLKSGKRFRL